MNTTKMIEATRFLKNVSKLDEAIHQRTHSSVYGTVTLQKPGYDSKSGKRVYTVSGSKMIRNGSYGWAALKSAVMSVKA